MQSTTAKKFADAPAAQHRKSAKPGGRQSTLDLFSDLNFARPSTLDDSGDGSKLGGLGKPQMRRNQTTLGTVSEGGQHHSSPRGSLATMDGDSDTHYAEPTLKMVHGSVSKMETELDHLKSDIQEIRSMMIGLLGSSRTAR